MAIWMLCAVVGQFFVRKRRKLCVKWCVKWCVKLYVKRWVHKRGGTFMSNSNNATVSTHIPNHVEFEVEIVFKI